MVIISSRSPVSDWARRLSRETSLVQFGHQDAQKKSITGFFLMILSKLTVSPLMALALKCTSLSPVEMAKQVPGRIAAMAIQARKEIKYFFMVS
jgi:hypothetical protein